MTVTELIDILLAHQQSMGNSPIAVKILMNEPGYGEYVKTQFVDGIQIDNRDNVIYLYSQDVK